MKVATMGFSMFTSEDVKHGIAFTTHTLRGTESFSYPVLPSRNRLSRDNIFLMFYLLDRRAVRMLQRAIHLVPGVLRLGLTIAVVAHVRGGYARLERSRVREVGGLFRVVAPLEILHGVLLHLLGGSGVVVRLVYAFGVNNY